MTKHLCFAVTALALSLAGCAGGNVTVNPTLLADGQLADATVAGLVPLLPVKDQGTTTAVLNIISADIAALQGGTMTQTAFATVVRQNITDLEPTLLADLAASPTIQAVAASLTTLAGELLTESAGTAPVAVTASAVPMFDPRPVLREFVATHPAK